MKFREAENARILDENLDKILRKDLTIEEVLKQYPGLKDELDAVLWVIQHQGKAASTQAFIHRSTPILLSRLGVRNVIRRGWLWFLRWNGSAQLRAALVAIMIVILGSMTGVVYAAQSSLPGQSFYQVKLVLEDWQSSLISNPESRTTFDILQLDTRLNEVDDLADRSDHQNIDTALAGYESAVQVAVAEIDNKDLTDEQKEILVLKLQEKLIDHMAHLEQLRERLPDQAQNGLDRAIMASVHGLTVAQYAVLGDHPTPTPKSNRTTRSTQTATTTVTATETPKIKKPTKTEIAPPIKGANDPEFTSGPPEKTSPSENRPTQKPRPTEKDSEPPGKPEKPGDK